MELCRSQRDRVAGLWWFFPNQAPDRTTHTVAQVLLSFYRCLVQKITWNRPVFVKHNACSRERPKPPQTFAIRFVRVASHNTEFILGNFRNVLFVLFSLESDQFLFQAGAAFLLNIRRESLRGSRPQPRQPELKLPIVDCPPDVRQEAVNFTLVPFSGAICRILERPVART